MADSAMSPHEAVTAVADYLKQNFPSLLIEHSWDKSDTSERFVLFTQDRGIAHNVIVSGEFLKDKSVSSIPKILKAYGVVELIRKNGKKPVTVTPKYATDVY